MNEEKIAIDFLKNKTTNYSLNSEVLHYYIVLYNLINNLQQQNQQLKEQLKTSEKARKEAIDYINRNSLYEEEYDYDYEENIYMSGIDDEEARRCLLGILDINKGE